MKRRYFLNTVGASGLFSLAMGSCAHQDKTTKREKLFTFIHFSDIHIQPEQGGKEGFLAAIAKMNSLKPDFVMSGGDLVMDSLDADETRATQLYDLYLDCAKKFEVPLYNVMGNHEVFGINVPDKVSINHPLWGKEMFKKRIGNGTTWNSFDHKGVHFVLLDSIGIVKNPDKPGHHYIGQIGEEQLAWLKEDLAKIDPATPVIAASHIPIFTLYMQVKHGPTFPTEDRLAITDGRALYELLASHRLFGYLQGHIHVNELYVYKKMQFIDTGAVCGAWWTGALDGHPEGFNLVTVWNDGITTEYITYGWDASKYTPPEKNAEVMPEWWRNRIG